MTSQWIRTRRISWIAGVVFCAVIALLSYRYLLGLFEAPNVAANAFASPWLKIHVTGAATALLVGSFQFLPASRRTAYHLWVGRLYVVACLVGGVSGFQLALGTTAGPVSGWGFGLLAVAWIATTANAWWLARQRRYAEHRRWMIRSWALTLAAVTLRAYLVLSVAAGLPFMPSYIAISWLCWIPNLALAELYLLTDKSKLNRAV